MDHRRFARTVVVCCMAGAAGSFAVFEAAPILCLAFLTVSEGQHGWLRLALGTALLGAWLFIGGPWLLAAMGVAFAWSVPAGPHHLSMLFAMRRGAALALVACVALAAPWATALADSVTAPVAGAAFGLWLGLATLPLHVPSEDARLVEPGPVRAVPARARPAVP